MRSERYDFDLIMAAISECTAGSSGYMRGRCPTCLVRLGSEGRFGNFAVHIDTGEYRCFRCHLRGVIPAKQMPAGWGTGPRKPRVGAPNIQESPLTHLIPPPEGFVEFASREVWYSAKAQPGIRYCLDRGLHPNLIRDAGIGFVPDPDDYRAQDRVIVPIRASDGKAWLGWVGRRWRKDSKLKYLYAQGMARGTTLYNVEALLRNTDKPCFVVEGAFDVLALWPDAIAVLGTYSDPQLQMMAQSKRRFVIVLDGDAHDQAMGMAMKLFDAGVPVGVIRLPGGVDPDEVPRDWLDNEAEKSLQQGIW